MASEPPNLPRSMLAWERRSRGPIKTHLRATPYPTPEIPPPDSNEVLVRVSTVGIAYSMGALLPVIPAFPFVPPLIPEFEFSGVVVAAGTQVPSDVREAGTRVMGFMDVPSVMLKGRGVLCEYLRIAGTSLAPIPDSMAGEQGLEEAAGLGACGATALAMLRAAAVKTGDRILINGASGTIGHLAVQLARHQGIVVVGVASGRNEAFVRGLGVDEVRLSSSKIVTNDQFVDYTAHADLAAHLATLYSAAPFDAVLDCVGVQSLYEASPAFLKPEGTVVNVGAMHGMAAALGHWFSNVWRPVWLGGTPRAYAMFSTVPTRESSMLLTQMVADGDLRMHVDSVWAAADVAKAYERVASKRARGKVLIKVQRGV